MSREVLQTILQFIFYVIDNIKNLETAKILDFGLADKFNNNDRFEDHCGTLVY